MKTLYQLISNVCAVAKPFIVPTMWLKYYKILFKIVTNNCFFMYLFGKLGGIGLNPLSFDLPSIPHFSHSPACTTYDAAGTISPLSRRIILHQCFPTSARLSTLEG